MRRILLATLAGAFLLAPVAAAGETREAGIAFINRAGQAERWQLLETITGTAADRVVRREFRRDGQAFHVEESRLADGRLVEVTVSDTRPGGEPVRITVDGDRLTFTPLYEGDAPRTETVAGEVLTVGQVAPRIADQLRRTPDLKTFDFRVPIAKALKTAPMRATVTSVTDTSFTVDLRSTDFIVQSFFMRDTFRMTVDRASGQLLAYAGQPEPYDLSSGRARSLWTEHRFGPASVPTAPAAGS